MNRFTLATGFRLPNQRANSGRIKRKRQQSIIDDHQRVCSLSFGANGPLTWLCPQQQHELHRFYFAGELAARVRRQDSLARFLNNRPHRRELVERNILFNQSDREREEERHHIGITLNRYDQLKLCVIFPRHSGSFVCIYT